MNLLEMNAKCKFFYFSNAYLLILGTKNTNQGTSFFSTVREDSTEKDG